MRETDVIKNDEGSITIKKEVFLKNIVDDKLNTEQKEWFNFIGGLILSKVANVLNKSQRRMSLSLKRHNVEEAASEVPKKPDLKESPKLQK